MMRFYTTNSFTGFYPVGAAAVVVAGDEIEAIGMISAALIAHGLDGDCDEVVEMSQFDKGVRILVDGDY